MKKNNWHHTANETSYMCFLITMIFSTFIIYGQLTHTLISSGNIYIESVCVDDDGFLIMKSFVLNVMVQLMVSKLC